MIIYECKSYGLVERPRSIYCGLDARIFITMNELSIFVDESGDFGDYDFHSPYYILSFVFHNQEIDITDELDTLNRKLNQFGLDNVAIHTGPIIRQEEIYNSMDMDTRRKIMRALIAFYRNVDIRFTTIHVEKRHLNDEFEMVATLSRQLSTFINNHLDYFLSFDVVKIYYDNGQIPVTRILSSVFGIFLSNVQFKKAIKPSKYRLFQIADMICSLELVRLKMEKHTLSKSELRFFGEPRVIRKNYLKALEKKRMY